ncbi:translation protein [Salmonella phage UPF_BP1]|nr:translation protein [Salmonella phage UPF_BP1]AOZ63941.1 translation protein [Salmonella phage UPF_BP1]
MGSFKTMVVIMSTTVVVNIFRIVVLWLFYKGK